MVSTNKRKKNTSNSRLTINVYNNNYNYTILFVYKLILCIIFYLLLSIINIGFPVTRRRNIPPSIWLLMNILSKNLIFYGKYLHWKYPNAKKIAYLMIRSDNGKVLGLKIVLKFLDKWIHWRLIVEHCMGNWW